MTTYPRGIDMRSTAKVLGILGGVFGVIFGLVAMFVGGVTFFVGGGLVAVLGFFAILFAIAGIVGGTLAENYRGASSALLLVAGVCGFICISAFWILPGILLIVGGILEITGRTTAAPTAAQAMRDHPPNGGAMSFCTKCGRQNPQGAGFCNSCGTPLGPVPPASTQNR
jgi:hypothetical protein